MAYPRTFWWDLATNYNKSRSMYSASGTKIKPVPSELEAGVITTLEEEEMGGSCSTHGEIRAHKMLVIRLEGKRPRGRPRRRW